ncbi:MAG: diacylglycerol kinase family lipid kinase [Acidobacteriaceae bacterium]|nr:diacylglycerol kinase family lipid kinase [Acidobacteriaceae bacterium]
MNSIMVQLRLSGAKRAAIIYNPIARGLARRKGSLHRITALLSERGIQASLVATHGPGTASEQVRREIDLGCHLVVAAGGDGTINEVANGMLHSGVPLAILPGGTANVLAREMQVPIHLERAAAQIPSLEPFRVAVGALRLRDSSPRCFLCMAGAGLDAEIVSRVDPALKIRTGKLAYYAGGLLQVFRPLREFEVTVDGKPYLASFALLSRVRNYGGDLEIARGASLLRDDFEVVLFRGTASARYLSYFLGVALKRVHRMPGCTVLRAQSIVCEQAAGHAIFVQIDGELAGTLPMSVDILPDALTMLAPASYLARERVFAGLAASERPSRLVPVAPE